MSITISRCFELAEITELKSNRSTYYSRIRKNHGSIKTFAISPTGNASVCERNISTK